MAIYTTRDTATQTSLGRLRELVLVWVLVGARALLHLLLASPLLVAVSPFTAARCCRASCFLLSLCAAWVLPPRTGRGRSRSPSTPATVVASSTPASYCPGGAAITGGANAEAAACCISVFRPSVVVVSVVVFIIVVTIVALAGAVTADVGVGVGVVGVGVADVAVVAAVAVDCWLLCVVC